MIVLYIILTLAAIILFLLLVDVSLVLAYKDGFKLKIRIFIFPLPVEKLVGMTSGEGKSGKDKSPKIPNATAKKKKTASDIVELISTIVDIIKAVLGEFVRYARLKLCRIKITIGSDDPAQTALIYGAASPVLYTAIEFFDSFLNIKKNYKNIGIAPDFVSDECRADIKIVLRIKIIHLLLALVNVVSVLAAKKGK